MELDFRSCLGAATMAAREAGLMVKKMSTSSLDVRSKGAEDSAGRDLVTRADEESEGMIKRFLHEVYPDYGFLGEETADPFTTIDPERPTWVVDPLDGTVNFAHGFHELVCVMIGLCYRNKPVLGVVYSPWLDQMYAGVEGEPSSLNGVRIRVSNTADPKKAMVSLGLTSKLPFRHATTRVFGSLITECRAPRVVGCAGLAMCLIARGAMDVYLAPRHAVWDMLAPSVILRGAGANITDATGESWRPVESPVVVSNGQPELHRWAISTLKDALQSAGT